MTTEPATRTRSDPDDGEPLAVALVGFGHGGAIFHAPLIDATPGLRLASIVTRSAERTALIRQRYPSTRVVGDVEGLLRGPEPLDVLVVASPNRMHVQHARLGLEHGLAVVVDKPLAPSSAEASSLIDDARKSRQLLTVFHNRRWDGDFLTLRRLVDAGRLGAIQRFESRFERWRPTRRDVWRESGDPAEAGGLLFDLGSHLIDQALVLLGPVRSVYAEVDRRRHGAQVDDDSFLALTHVNGARSHLWVSQVAAHTGPRFRVLGSAGAFVVSGLDPQEQALADGARPVSSDWGRTPPERWGVLDVGGTAEPVPSDAGAYPAFYAQLRDAVRGSACIPVDPADAVRGLTIIEAAQRSGRERRVIDL